jgi:hypothetical protein
MGPSGRQSWPRREGFPQVALPSRSAGGVACRARVNVGRQRLVLLGHSRTTPMGPSGGPFVGSRRADGAQRRTILAAQSGGHLFSWHDRKRVVSPMGMEGRDESGQERSGK